MHRRRGRIVVHAVFPCSGLRSWNSLKRALSRSNRSCRLFRWPFTCPSTLFCLEMEAGNQGTETPGQEWRALDPLGRDSEDSRAPLPSCVTFLRRTDAGITSACHDSGRVKKRKDRTVPATARHAQYRNDGSGYCRVFPELVLPEPAEASRRDARFRLPRFLNLNGCFRSSFLFARATTMSVITQQRELTPLIRSIPCHCCGSILAE